ncbi:hypothetical protein Mycsm_02348 [Mycobacterium sp. JS623]|nr:hypothetical protein Mycsm_02348 [Mycobacterium sp. JS623]
MKPFWTEAVKPFWTEAVKPFWTDARSFLNRGLRDFGAAGLVADRVAFCPPLSDKSLTCDDGTLSGMISTCALGR